MNKKTWLIVAFLVIVIIGVGIYFYFQNNTSSGPANNYEANRTSANNSENSESQEDNNTWDKENENQNNVPEERQGITDAKNNGTPPVTEEQISTFSTKIYSNDRGSSK